jgi:hypothetical protein
LQAVAQWSPRLRESAHTRDYEQQKAQRDVPLGFFYLFYARHHQGSNSPL